ncbi:hypothetical protein [Methylocystis sp. SB2]|uniref:hypothetical protein n=1 Tax=Methylocystis sp. (strain SB2) TaxID=743836 RepID=UPI0004170FE1|nr:hypothetical protein [Methylocystis sp. SB2]ULO24258.1 hypothetical protein LNB28_02270 [Methylocystis sp. SB2]
MQTIPKSSAESLRRYLLNLDDQEFALTWRDALEKGDMTDAERTIFREVSDERSWTHDARHELQARRDLAQFMGGSHAEH